MTNLLVLREHLKKIYSKYETFITPGYKFLLTFVSLLLINSRLGYMVQIDNIGIVLMVALLCSLMPLNFIVVVSAVFTIAHLYAFSLECALISGALFLLMFILYFRFSPKATMAVLLTPICFVLKIPYVVPIAVGLMGTPASAIAVCCGVIVYYTVLVMNQSAAVLGTFGTEDMIPKYRYVIDSLLGNKTMLVAVLGFAATVVVVYVIRRLSVDYSWMIATITGALLNIMIILLGDLVFSTNISIIGLLLGSIVSVLLVQVLQFFVFNVNYSRTELVQFEDDEYYYYVKAVPKNTVSTPEKRIKTIKVPEKVINSSKKDTH